MDCSSMMGNGAYSLTRVQGRCRKLKNVFTGTGAIRSTAPHKSSCDVLFIFLGKSQQSAQFKPSSKLSQFQFHYRLQNRSEECCHTWW